MSWTDERVELLRKLWNDGLSASQIAGELANGITRNAVIGKVHRLGLSGRAKSPTSAARPRTPRQVRTVQPVRTHMPAMRGNLAFAMAPRIVEAPQPRMMAEVVVPMTEPVTIMELRESMCRWPLGDPSAPEFRYCGGDAPIGDGPYCRFHARIAYQPTQSRQRRN
jgi:GcrA cell cycle regulator